MQPKHIYPPSRARHTWYDILIAQKAKDYNSFFLDLFAFWGPLQETIIVLPFVKESLFCPTSFDKNRFLTALVEACHTYPLNGKTLKFLSFDPDFLYTLNALFEFMFSDLSVFDVVEKPFSWKEKGY